MLDQPAFWSNLKVLVPILEAHEQSFFAVRSDESGSQAFLLDVQTAQGGTLPVWLFAELDMFKDEWVVAEAPLANYSDEFASRLSVMSSIPMYGRFGAYGRQPKDGLGAVGLRWSARASSVATATVVTHVQELANVAKGMLELLNDFPAPAVEAIDDLAHQLGGLRRTPRQVDGQG